MVVGHAGGISERQLCFTSSCSLVSFAFGSRSVYEGKTHNTHELFSCCDASQQGVDRVSRDDCVCVCMFSGPVHSKRFVLFVSIVVGLWVSIVSVAAVVCKGRWVVHVL